MNPSSTGLQARSPETARKRIVRKIKEKGEAAIDRSLHKVISRKLLVWGTATVAMFIGMVDATNWVDICMVYIGSEAAANIVSSLRRSTKEE